MFFAFLLLVAIAVKIISYVAEFDGFGDGKLRDFVFSKKNIQGVFDFDGRDKDKMRNVSVGVIFGHAGKNDIWAGVIFGDFSVFTTAVEI